MPALPVEQRKRNFQEIELGLSEEAAKEEAERCLSCECKLCVKDCEFLRHYCQTPKELAEKFKAGYFKENPVIPYSCNLCELCKKHCPEELCVGDMCLEIRERMVEEGIGPLPQHKMIIEDAEWALSPAFALSLPDPATGDCKRAFFTGCNLPAYSPSLVLATYDYLREKLPGTGIILRCCGEPYHGLGLSDPFKEAMAGLEQEMKKLGATELIVPCPECYRTLKRANPSFKLRTLYEVLLEVGIPQPPGDGKAIFSLHDSCTARGEPAFQDSARELIKLTGHEIEELPHSRDLTLCCGQGGLIMPVNPMRVLGLAKDRLAEAHHDVVSYCAACRETFSIHRPSVHVLDLIFNPNWQEDMKRRPNKPSVRKENQAQLKKLLLEKAKKA
jgi:Fe-S oxidoreductase